MNEICSTDLLGLTNNSKDLNLVTYIQPQQNDTKSELDLGPIYNTLQI